ncbi:abortive infection family protein [Nocardia fluminea]|uniref:abortive infection family protein n=1 Tax=Nocardia fluminea TaxID=134984 RepID=UPI003D0F1DEC
MAVTANTVGASEYEVLTHTTVVQTVGVDDDVEWDDLDEWVPGVEDLEEAVDLVDQLCGALIAASTKKNDGDARAYRKNYQKLAKILDPSGIRRPFPWANLDDGVALAEATFTGYGSYARRREYFFARAESVKKLLLTRINDRAAGDVAAAVSGLLDASGELIAEPAAIRVELTRIESSLSSDPSAVIGKAKNLIEATAKAVLVELGQPYKKNASFDARVKEAMKAVGIGAETAAGYGQALADVADRLTELTIALRNLRNQIGDGHGHGDDTFPDGLDLRYGRLAARSAIAWSAFMLDTLHDRRAGED